MKSIAFFDFDGTLYKGDSMLTFIAFLKGRSFLYRNLLLLSPRIALMKLGLADRQKTKEALLKRALQGVNQSDIQSKTDEFGAILDASLFPRAVKVLDKHLVSGTEICVVSASCRLWLEPWCRRRGFSLICSELAVENGVFTGLLKGLNCRGQEKVDRILSVYDLSAFDKIYCYGNDTGDNEMLGLSNQPLQKLHTNEP